MINFIIQISIIMLALISVLLKNTALSILFISLLIVINIYNLISEKKLKNKSKLYNLENLGDVDFLTGLYNRVYFTKSIEKLINKKEEFSLYIIDLNNFKQINDVYGHDIGDLVLKEVGKRFKNLENEDVLFARFGGDEFAAVYKSVNDNTINHLGTRINDSLKEHIIISESEFTITASVGVSKYPFDSENVLDLLKLADMAMYHAKKSNLSEQYLISEELNNKLSKRKKIEKLLKKLNPETDLFLEYQPIYDFSSDEIIGVEALVRWNHSTEGIIYPEDFINVSEEIDIVKDITKWTFITGLNQIKHWNETYNKNLKLSLNVSNSCIHNKIFFENLKFMLENFKIKSNWLALELKEMSLSITPNYMKELLTSITELGVDIFIDDFGTSAIILPELLDFNVKAIKIDNRYISGEKKDLNISKSMIELAHSLGIKAVAEAIETEEQYNELNNLNCDYMQGFFKGSPISNEEFEKKYLK